MACALESLEGTAFQSALLCPKEKIQALADPEPAGEDAAFGPEPPTQHLYEQSLLVLRLRRELSIKHATMFVQGPEVATLNAIITACARAQELVIFSVCPSSAAIERLAKPLNRQYPREPFRRLASCSWTL